MPSEQVDSDNFKLREQKEDEEFQQAIKLSQQEQVIREQAARDKAQKEEVRNENARREEILRQEQLKREQNKQEQLKQEQLKQEQLKQERLKQELLQQELLKQERLKQEQANKEQAKMEQAAKEEARKEEARRAERKKVLEEQKRLEELREEQERLAKIRRNEARFESIVSSLATDDTPCTLGCCPQPASSSSTYSTRNHAASQPPLSKQETYRQHPTATTCNLSCCTPPVVSSSTSSAGKCNLSCCTPPAILSSMNSAPNRAESQFRPPKQNMRSQGPTFANSTASFTTTAKYNGPGFGAVDCDETIVWDCDVCDRELEYTSPHNVCTECEDYLLCNPCYEKGHISKSHLQTHGIRQIQTTYDFAVADFVAADEHVNPEDSFGAKNWTIGESDIRWLSLRKTNHHARFMATGLERGQYYIELELHVKLSPKFAKSIKYLTAGDPLCKLKVHYGKPKDRKTFAHGRFVEDASLATKVFSTRRHAETAVDITTDVAAIGILTISFPSNTHFFRVSGDKPHSNQFGVLLQWEDVTSFTNSDDAVLQID